MRRYETQQVTVEREVEVEAKCDRCGVTDQDAPDGLMFPVVIEINVGEEGGRRDELDYCNNCLVELAPVLAAAGSRSFLVTREETEDEDE